MGRTNDSIIYGGVVQLIIDGPEDDLKELSKNLPSSSSKDYGKPFADIFNDYKGDFYSIDPNLFSPGKVTVRSIDTGKIFEEGKINSDLINRSFRYEKN